FSTLHRDLHSFPTRRSSDLSTGDESSTSTFTTFPEISDSISLKSFMASIIHRTSPSLIIWPTSTKTGLSGEGLRYKVPIIGDFIDRKSTRLNSSHVKISYAV